MFTKENLIAGETVLVRKTDNKRALYLGNAGLANFISQSGYFEAAGSYAFTIQELNELYTIEQPKSKVVPLEKKVYDFVPVRVRDMVSVNWKNRLLIAVTPGTEYPFKTVDEKGHSHPYKYCEFLNEQQQ